MSAPLSPFRQARRLEWVDGSALTWRDLRDAVGAEESMLALHMRGLHDTWGVALGLTTLLAGDQRSVLVTPGFAITCVGMSMLLPSAQVLGPPAGGGATATAWDLVLEAPAAMPGDPCNRPTTCDLEVPPRRAAVRWHRADTPLDQRAAVVLARYLRLPTGLLAGPDLDGRRGVRVLERPHIASGVVSAGSISWTTSGDGLLASVDTSDAGFTRPAVYRVWVASHDPWPANVVGALVSAVSAGRTSVNVQCLVPGTAAGGVARTVAAGLSLGWLGVEPARGCPPAFTTTQIFAPLSLQLDLSVWAAALAAVPGFRP